MITQPGPASRRGRGPWGRGRSGVVRWLLRSRVLMASSIGLWVPSTLEIKGTIGVPLWG